MICPQCNKEFIPTGRNQNNCSKECSLISQRETQKIYKKSLKGKERDKKYQQSIKGKIASKKANKNYSNTEKGKAKRKELHKKNNNSAKGKLSKKNWQKSDNGRKYKSQYFKKRRQIDPIFVLKDNCRTRLERFLKSKNFHKTNKTFDMIGCSAEFLKEHLEKQFHRHPDTYQPMNWLNHTVHGWHIDHIIPLDSAKTPEDVEKLMHYTNLQPMWAEYNIKKGNKIN